MSRNVHRTFACIAIMMLSSSAFAQARVIFTEIMYNPASNEKHGESEWIEIANVGDLPIEIKDWTLKVDQKKTKWGTFSCTLAPGGVAVLVNAAFVNEGQFRAAWDSEADSSRAEAKLEYQVIPLKWGALANDQGSHALQLLNEQGETVCELKHDAHWPKVSGSGGPSIFLADLSASEFTNGELWRISQIDLDGARNNRTTDIFDKADCGSPGYVAGLNGNPAATTAATPDKSKKPAKPKNDAGADNANDGRKIDY